MANRHATVRRDESKGEADKNKTMCKLILGRVVNTSLDEYSPSVSRGRGFGTVDEGKTFGKRLRSSRKGQVWVWSGVSDGMGRENL